MKIIVLKNKLMKKFELAKFLVHQIKSKMFYLSSKTFETWRKFLSIISHSINFARIKISYLVQNFTLQLITSPTRITRNQ